MPGLLISSADNSHRGSLRKQGLDHYEPLFRAGINEVDWGIFPQLTDGDTDDARLQLRRSVNPRTVTEAIVGVISCLRLRPSRGGGSGARVVRL